MRFIRIVFPLLILLITSCETQWQQQEQQDLYQITVPDFMEHSTTKSGDDEFPFYQNTRKELYLTVIHESKANEPTDASFGLQDYTQLVIETLEEAVEEAKVVSPVAGTLSELPTLNFELTGKLKENGADIHYLVTVVEGEKYYYQITTWTLADQMNDERGTLEKMTKSFVELKKG